MLLNVDAYMFYRPCFVPRFILVGTELCDLMQMKSNSSPVRGGGEGFREDLVKEIAL